MLEIGTFDAGPGLDHRILSMVAFVIACRPVKTSSVGSVIQVGLGDSALCFLRVVLGAYEVTRNRLARLPW